MIQFEGYAPDYDSTIPGLFTNCNQVIPTLKGFKAAAAPRATVATSALAAACLGAAVLKKLDDTNRLFAGTATALYELIGSTWTDRTRAVGGAYSATNNRWRFAQFGNVSLAAQKGDVLQQSTTAAFSNITGAPQTNIVETVNSFVFAFDTNEATFGDSPNRWWCSAFNNHADWTPAVSTQSASGLLDATPGKITAGRKFGDAIVAYKERSMYLGLYVGPPDIWQWRLLPGEFGALSHEAVANVGTTDNPRHIFMGFDDFYSFDGARPIPIGTGLKETVFGELNRTNQRLCTSLHDLVNSLVYFYYPVSSTLDKCVVYNYRTNKWGRDDRSVEAALQYVAPSITYGELGSTYSTYADFPSLSYGSAFLSAQSITPAIFNTSHVLQTLDGTPTTSSITTGDYGDDFFETYVRKLKPRFFTAPTTASVVNYYRDLLSNSLTTDSTTSIDTGKFDLYRSAKWHRFRFDFTGAWEASGVQVDSVNDGSE